MKRTSLCWMAVVLGLAPFDAERSTAGGDYGKPNIILCMPDDQGWGDTSDCGHPELKTPERDKMVASGIRFDRFHTAFPLCSPTRGSCLTGRYPACYRGLSWGHDLPLREVTMAEAHPATAVA